MPDSSPHPPSAVRRFWTRLLLLGCALVALTASLAAPTARAACRARVGQAKWCNGGGVDCYYGSGLQGLTRLDPLNPAPWWIHLAIHDAINAVNLGLITDDVPLLLFGPSDVPSPAPTSRAIIFTYGATSLGSGGCSSSRVTIGDTDPGQVMFYTNSQIGQLTLVKIDFNSQFSGWSSQTALTTAFHEIGHALGVDHVSSRGGTGCPTNPKPLMSRIYTCSDNLQPDSYFWNAIYCLYGSLDVGCHGASLGGLVTKVKFGRRVRHIRSQCNGCGSCLKKPEIAPASPAAAAATTTYELAISDAGGPFATFATLGENDWVDNAYEYEFTQNHVDAEVRMRTLNGGVPVDSVFADPLDILAPVAVGEPGGGTSLRLTASPNPFRSRTALTVSLPRDQEVRLWISDATGRRVRALASGAMEAGSHTFAWNGLDDRGAAAPNGFYYLRADCESGHVIRGILRIR